MTSCPVLPPSISKIRYWAISSGSHELHLPGRGQHGELLHAEDAVLTRVDVGGLEDLVGGPGGVGIVRREGLAQGTGLRLAQLDGLATAIDGAPTDLLPGDGGGRLDLLGDRGARRARHQEEQHRVGTGEGALRQQHPAGFLLGVGVGDVETHAARAAGADLHVAAGLDVDHAAVEQLDVADQARHVESLEKILHRAQIALPLLDLVPQFLGRSVDVPVGDAGGGVDAVDHDLRPAFVQQPVEQERAQVRVQQRFELGADRLHPWGIAVEGEDVAGRDRELDAFGEGRELHSRLLGLLQSQAVDLNLSGSTLQQLTAHSHAHEPIPAQHQHLGTFDVHEAPPSNVQPGGPADVGGSGGQDLPELSRNPADSRQEPSAALSRVSMAASSSVSSCGNRSPNWE